jgi:ectoine hydroxylase
MGHHGANMDLSNAQVEAYQREGFLVVERAFAPPEMAALEAAMPEITESPNAKVGRDQASGTVRLSHGAHLYSEAFRRLSFHPRLVRPAQRLLGTDVHLYQSRLTMKAGLGALQASTGWPWHQDFSTWHLHDGMPEPRCVIIFIFLDDVTASNAPLLVIPRSHKNGIIGKESDAVKVAGGQYTQVIIQPNAVREVAEQGGVAALMGPVGTVAFMHCSLVHGSTENISPMRRALFTVAFNAIDNRARHPRSEHFGAAVPELVRPLADDCLLTLAR